MNTPVNFELAKLLKEKGFNNPKNTMYCRSIPMFEKHHVVKFHDGNKHECSNIPHDWNNTHSPIKSTSYYSAPTIAEVVMWLYEKHGVWIYSVKSKYGWMGCVKDYSNEELKTIYTTHSEQMFLAGESDKWYKSPTEAYESAIEYVLTNII